MNETKLSLLAHLAEIYKTLAQGTDNRADPTDDIEKALNRLEGIIFVTVNQLEQP